MRPTYSTIPLLCIVALILISGCAKTGPEFFKGNYSFKTSGCVTAAIDSSCKHDTTILELPDTITVDVITENGQMDITEVDPDNGRMVITMNTVGGDIIVYYANATGNTITIDPKKRHYGSASTSSISIIDSQSKQYDISLLESSFVVSGTGTKYDNIVLFRFEYNGYIKIGKLVYNIVSSDIDCRAKLN